MKIPVKWGLWFAGIGLIAIILAINDYLPPIFFILYAPLLAIAIFFSSIVLRCSAVYNSCPIQMVFGFAVSLIILFGIGALIGWIIGKVKERKGKK